MALYSISIFLLIISSCHAVIDIEKHLKICDRNSLEINECLTDAIQEALKALRDGNKELGVPPLDPYFQKELRVEYNNNQIRAKMEINDIVVIGLSTSTVRDVRLKANEDKFHLEIDLYTPQIIIKGQYKGGGSYNSLKILANGEFNNTMTGLVYTWKVDGIPEVIDGVTYIRAKSFYMRPDVSTMKIFLTNDNPDTKEITELGVKISNENWRTLYKELLPYAESNWNKIGMRITNKIFLKVPYDVLFPLKS